MRENLQNQRNRAHVTLRDIAAELGVSHVSVSKALRNLPGVSDVLKSKIKAKADAMGYVPDPLLASLSRYRKNDQPFPIQSQLAWLNPWSDSVPTRERKEFDLYWDGAVDSAQRLGYHIESFTALEFSVVRLQGIFKARSIQGILIPPLRAPIVELEQFDWSNFAVVRFGQANSGLKMHSVGSSQVENTILAWKRIRGLGYKRIGFVCEYFPSRFFGAGYDWAQRQLKEDQRLPLLAFDPADEFERQQSIFASWLSKCVPDAILTDNSETYEMLQNLGYRIPEDIGLATTSIHDTSINAGIDQCPYQIGRAAVRMLTGLIAERSCGLPDQCNETLIVGKWSGGAMLPNVNER